VHDLVAVNVAVDPDAWRALGFAVDDEDVCAVDAVAIRLGSAGRKISGWALADVPGGVEVDGLPTVPAPTPRATAASHANGTIALNHLVVMSPDPDRTIKALAAYGIEPRRQRHTDQYGPPFTQTFFRLGRPILELVGPATPTGPEPARFYGIAFTVDDVDATAARLGDGLGRVKDAVQPGRRIATLRRDAGAGIPLAFMSPGADSLAAGASSDEAQ
jgi:Glyoxalase/Bleomycin resistance protein/Dioxygenase superfamily